MSVERALAALLEFDLCLAEQIEAAERQFPVSDDIATRRPTVERLLADMMGTWSLSLAAASAGIKEQRIVAALALSDRLRFGSPNTVRRVVGTLYKKA